MIRSSHRLGKLSQMASFETPQRKFEHADELMRQVSPLREKSDELIRDAIRMSKKADEIEELARKFQGQAMDDRKCLCHELDGVLQQHASVVARYNTEEGQRLEIEQVTLAVEEGRASRSDIAVPKAKLFALGEQQSSTPPPREQSFVERSYGPEQILQPDHDGDTLLGDSEMLEQAIDKYQPQYRQLDLQEQHYICVNGLFTDMSEDFLRQVCWKWKPSVCIIPGSYVHGRGASLGFIGFTTVEDASNALQVFHRGLFPSSNVSARLLRKPKREEDDLRHPIQSASDRSRKRRYVDIENQQVLNIAEPDSQHKRTCLREEAPSQMDRSRNDTHRLESTITLHERRNQDKNTQDTEDFGADFIPFEENPVDTVSTSGRTLNQQPCPDEDKMGPCEAVSHVHVGTLAIAHGRADASDPSQASADQMQVNSTPIGETIKQEKGESARHRFSRSESDNQQQLPASHPHSIRLQNIARFQAKLLSHMLKISASSCDEARAILHQQYTFYQKSSQERKFREIEDIYSEKNLAGVSKLTHKQNELLKVTLSAFGQLQFLRVNKLKMKHPFAPGRLFLVRYTDVASCENAAKAFPSHEHGKLWHTWRPKI